jgi:hypothetical protein
MRHTGFFVLHRLRRTRWRALVRRLGRREHMSDIAQAVAGLLSHQQTVTLGHGLQGERRQRDTALSRY